MDRRSFLVAMRKKIAVTIDDGVPPHALARLMSEAASLDAEIRRLDAAQDEEQELGAHRDRRSFAPEAI